MRHRLAETGAEKVTAVEIAAGDDVTLVGGPGDLAERCAEFFRRRPGDRLVAEEFLPGTLRTLETGHLA